MMMEKAQEGQQQPMVGARVVHSQVRRIKQEEDEKVKVHETYYQHHAAEMRRLVLRGLGGQRSRSPLGRAAARPAIISIGGDS
ncbi:unnamed protein product [Urochloa decumbens]|uniref:Uncharacterized protein n=1 Tax=Urochloa decumbens TaxID=240449 RepID=A0ABC8V723_9POAL